MYHEPSKDTYMENEIVVNDSINMLKLLKILFLISMLIFVEHLDLVKRIKLKMNIVSIIRMKKLELGTRL